MVGCQAMMQLKSQSTTIEILFNFLYVCPATEIRTIANVPSRVRLPVILFKINNRNFFSISSEIRIGVNNKFFQVYELVKKKNIGTRIIIGIIALFLITTVLKMIFRQQEHTLNDELVKSANEINKHAPIILDSLTRLDNVMALPGYILQYNYTITNANREDIDTNILKQQTKEGLLDKIKNDPKAEFFRENNVELQARYVDKNGIYLCSVSVTPYDYKSKK